jgi:hypothetical protein
VQELRKMVEQPEVVLAYMNHVQDNAEGVGAVSSRG